MPAIELDEFPKRRRLGEYQPESKMSGENGKSESFSPAYAWPIGSSGVIAVPDGILITPDGSRAFVASTPANKVMVIDLKTLTVAGTIELGPEPDGMAWAGT